MARRRRQGQLSGQEESSFQYNNGYQQNGTYQPDGYQQPQEVGQTRVNQPVYGTSVDQDPQAMPPTGYPQNTWQPETPQGYAQPAWQGGNMPENAYAGQQTRRFEGTPQPADPTYAPMYNGQPAADPAYDAGYDALDMPFAPMNNMPPEGYQAEESMDPGIPPEMPADEEDYTEEEKTYPHSIFKPNTRKPSFVLSVLVNVVRCLLLLVILAGLAGVGAVAGIAKGYVETAPTLDLTVLDKQDQTSFIYDCNNNLITEYKGVENRVMVSIDAMPKYLQQAFIAVEDSRFYTHNGVDLKRIIGAFVSNLSSSSMQGGSTITQQLIKNTLLSSEQSYKRKIQEAYLAMQLEMNYTKDEILQSYLNTIYLGENYYGVQVAAQGYFGKTLGELTLRECAMLAGTNNSPYYYDPRKNFYTRQKEGVDYPAITNDRTDYVLSCMYQNQFISWEQYQEALDPATAHVLQTDPSEGTGMYPYAHYVEYAVDEVIDIFLEMEGLENTATNRAAMENRLRTGGYYVKLAIDPSIQDTVQDTLSNWSQYPSLRDPSDKVFRSRNSDGTYTEIAEPQAAAVVLDYHTGELKAIIGSRNKVTARKTLNRATDMRMPVGSSIKPIAVYAPALELGASPASIVYNMPLPIPGWRGSDGKDTWPRNYSGSSYTGPMTLRAAIKNSYNTSAAWTSMTMVGVSRSVDFLHRLGIDDAHIDATPFGVTLGSSGVTPVQMAVAYGVLANGGVYQEPISVLGISDSSGKVVWDGHANQERRRVFSESTAWMTVDMMKLVVSGGSGTKAKIKGQTVAGKTGTNSDQKGVFFCGMTGYYSSALWIGHDNYKALSSKATGGNAAAPLWSSYMGKIHANLANRDILDGSAADYGLVKVTTCAVSGQLATEACLADTTYGTVTDWWANGTQPTVYCQMHTTQRVCAQSGQIATQFCPNTTSRSVITIPSGHPLYQYIGTEYNDVLTEYLGPWATVKYNENGMLVSGGATCALHGPGSTESTNTFVQNTLIPDAQVLINQAQTMMQTMDPASAQYQNTANAINYLQSLISSDSPSQSEVANAMSALTRAMAGL